MAVSGRIYTTGFQNVAITAVQDLVSVTVGTTHIIGVQSVVIGQITGTTNQNLRVRIRYLPTTVTAGSGGGAGTVGKWVSGDAAAVVTSRINDTTQATSSGTAVDLWDDVWNTINGFYWQAPDIRRPPVIGISGALVLSLDTAPSGSITCNATVTFEELP